MRPTEHIGVGIARLSGEMADGSLVLEEAESLALQQGDHAGGAGPEHEAPVDLVSGTGRLDPRR
ncbi:MAG: hypothetical protein ACRECD_03265 [Burkholderiaceae bacterium]